MKYIVVTVRNVVNICDSFVDDDYSAVVVMVVLIMVEIIEVVMMIVDGTESGSIVLR